jgi:hypothetical protein
MEIAMVQQPGSARLSNSRRRAHFPGIRFLFQLAERNLEIAHVLKAVIDILSQAAPDDIFEGENAGSLRGESAVIPSCYAADSVSALVVVERG